MKTEISIKNNPPLGAALPDSPHAVSVSLPEWADVVGYEEGEARVLNAMQLGYPRFVYHPKVKELFAACEKEFSKEGEFAIALPSKKIAKLCVDYCNSGRIEQFKTVFAVILPEAAREKAKQFWQHSGFIISSRQAENILKSQQPATNSQQPQIKKHLAKLANADADDVYLYPSGMAAIFAAYLLVNGMTREGAQATEGKAIEAAKAARRLSAIKTIQLGFPYVDTLKIQQRFGAHEFIGYDDYDKLQEIVSRETISAIFTEYPLNPLLDLVDFAKLREFVGETPLIIDDTLSTWENFRALDFADIAVTSLTKFYSGIGDVLAGCLILNKTSPHYAKFKQILDTEYENLLYQDDAEVLYENGQGYEKRIKIINKNAKDLAEFLNNQIRNPKTKILNFGGIISIILENEEQAIKFYDNLEVNKGPSLGTEYTLACPYTLLAHYRELDWAAAQNVPAHLIRISVGCEDIEKLKQKFAKDLASI
ncbi:MAG: hypothetical protein COV36_01140 [Alphaproteobacteria bacterium CG11_big_fil_rev_8_21_14_0_20_44_7]|nr:MAG: hypothetical protein COV36_01140 [Alphaproteobacteria bacterium CG11_big_fil_rev_8_21_14_0_20_44_7]